MNKTEEMLKRIEVDPGAKEFCNKIMDNKKLIKPPRKPKFNVETKFNGSVYLRKRKLLESEG
jgi:hypothetical protein